jgi:hypothetical protein
LKTKLFTILDHSAIVIGYLCANSLNSVFVRPKCCFSSRFIAHVLYRKPSLNQQS